MNYLPLLLLIIPFLTKKEKVYKEILSSITVNDLLTILPLFGIKEDQIQAVVQVLPTILSEEFNPNTFIKQLLPLLLSTFNTTQHTANYEPVNSEPLEPVSSFINEEISNSLRAYFS